MYPQIPWELSADLLGSVERIRILTIVGMGEE